MSRESKFLRKRERFDITLPMLLDYYLTSKEVKGCSPKTDIALGSVLHRFIRFLEGLCWLVTPSENGATASSSCR